MLTRRTDGSPVPWQQRRRLTPTTAPAHANGGFDRAEVIAEGWSRTRPQSWNAFKFGIPTLVLDY